MEETEMMEMMVSNFRELTPERWHIAGGKGGTLSRLFQAGYPVPDGFVILPSAFDGDKLKHAAWEQVQTKLDQLRQNGTAFAVRSSALSEDSAFASFAGEFETVLDVHSDEMIRDAIHTVRRSRHSQRVKAYSKAKGMEDAHEIAVVVQQLVRADISGVLFTAEPVSGSRSHMLGNFVHGFGEELVSGEAEAYTFTLHQPKGRYQGPPVLKRFARKLFSLAMRLEKELGCPQDIEWCLEEGRLFLLQSRPITTLREYDPVNYDWNSSYTGDYLWARQEPFPEVVTPSTWSLWRSTFLSTEIAGIPSVGNIGGRIYLNISLPYSLLLKLGKSHQDAVDLFDVIVSPLPSGVEIPRIPLAFRSLLKGMIVPAVKMTLKQNRLKKDASGMLESMPGRCEALRQEIRGLQTNAALLAFWQENSLIPLFSDWMLLLDAMTEAYRGFYHDLKKSLNRLVGEQEANALISTISSGSRDLTSIGPIIGLSQVLEGQMSREAYQEKYGHRHANENELMQPRPYEDLNWLEVELQAFERNPVDIQALRQKRAADFHQAWERFDEHHPQKTKSLQKIIDGFIDATHKREAVRGEITRLVGVIRAFTLRAGEVLDLGEEVFFLTQDELIQTLSGDRQFLDYLTARRATYQNFKTLPPYPGWIRGRFNPQQWAADPNHRGDFYDAFAQPVDEAETNILKGHPGSSGRVEGWVRRIDGPEEGHLLRAGEILVAVTTNVGWTPLFPRAAAVITDIGAPLAHAAIVARELGIPAVVGCSKATSRLKTGDRVLVDGAAGTVEILPSESE